MVTFEAIVRSFLWSLRGKELRKCCQSKSAGSSSNLKDATQLAKTWGKLSLELNLLSSSDWAERNVNHFLIDHWSLYLCSTTQRMNFRLVSCVGVRNSLTLEAVKVRFGNGDVVTIGSHSFFLVKFSFTTFLKASPGLNPSVPLSLTLAAKFSLSFDRGWLVLTFYQSITHPLD